MRLFCLLLIVTHCWSTSAQGKIYHEVFDKQDGLQIEQISDIALDRDGFLWISGSVNKARATIVTDQNQAYLQRFNGVDFQTIALPDDTLNDITDIYLRKDDTFYLVINRMLYLFDPITTRFTPINLELSEPNLSNIENYNNKTYILSNEDLDIIVYELKMDHTITEVFRFTTNVNRIKVDHKTRFIPYKDYVVISDKNFPITFVSWQGDILKTINPEDFQNDRERALRKKWIDNHFEKDGQHYVLLYNNPQLYRIDEALMELVPVTSHPQFLPSDNLEITQDIVGNHLIATSYGNQLSLTQLAEEEALQTIYADADFGPASGISLLSNNLNKELWLTTNSTLHYYQFPEQHITNLLPDTEIRAMTSLSADEYLIATEFDGWYNFNSSIGNIKPYNLTEKGKIFKPHASRNFFQLGNTIWSNDTSGGIIAVDTTTREIQYYRHYPILCMVQPTDSTIVYGTHNYNLMEFNLRSRVHESLLPTDSLRILDLEWQAKDHTIIASTNKGLLTYNLNNRAHTFYNDSTQLDDPFLLMADYHPDYGYLLGSRKGTLTAFDLETQQFNILYKDDLQAGIATVLFDDQENWWINTFNGIVLFDPETQNTTRFSVKDGLTNNEANRYAALKTPDGFLVGTIKGLNFFQPENLQPKENTAQLVPLRIRSYDPDVKQFTNILDRSTLLRNKAILLPSENRALEVDFSLTQVDITRNERYRYRLNTSEWTELGAERSLRFPNLAAGNYALEVEALDFSGNKIGESLLLNIRSKNFFYKTGWFYLCISLASIVFLLWLVRQQQQRKQLQEQFSQDLMQSQEDERARIAKDLHDSVGQQLTLIKRQLQEQGQNSMSTLTNNALEEVRQISRGLYPVIIQQLGLSGSIEQLLFDVDEQTDLFVSAQIDDIDTHFNKTAALHLYRFIQENVSNVIKHAKAKALTVSISRTEKHTTIVISDNGKGFDVAEKQKNNSLGLKTLEERIRILAGTLVIESTPKTGTHTTAIIPHSDAKS